ncbi:haloacid dehalogenase [Robertmurraya siralis]|uniref:Haloacid dehalogenase n=1 Tax=Robertmurraya siralis TaxID=77777 RepID=A0A919WFM7_9BACI|nr:HAD-IA family hydrolase [Robertmurraya siralis]PAE22509.1 HAD family hydrolase [Bacillus sp. 7504-2]GIN61093.1 haloacid dehalogenase [Robertmurraya siralis]
MIKAIIFDFDGTLVDTETLWYKMYKDVLLEKYEVHLPLEEFAKVIGTTDEALYSYVHSQTKTTIDFTELEMEIKSKIMEQKDQLVLREGAADLIKKAKSMNLKIGIASSSPRKWIEDILEHVKIRDSFSVIKTKDDVSEVKPNPELYLKAMEELEVLPHETLAIEDSANGSIAAIEAGIKTVIVPNEVTKFLTFDKRVSVYQHFSDIQLS